MSWLLFIDESGQDHNHAPYEVRGGVAIHASKIEKTISDTSELLNDMFGDGTKRNEIKGSTLLDKRNFDNLSRIDPKLGFSEIKEYTIDFQNGIKTRNTFQSHAFTSIQTAKKSFEILRNNDAKLFASIVPRGSPKIADENILRKDFVDLLTLFSQFLKEKSEYGILIMDQVEQSHDKELINCIRSASNERPDYFSNNVVSTPLFVSSDMSQGIQLADLCLYAVNWGGLDVRSIPYTSPFSKSKIPQPRPEIADLRSLISPLVWRNKGKESAFYFGDF